ncbi:2-oxoglutarate dehydrogenase complex dihydrolipoyllysine-residue succinyltransferase [Cohnella herbarum]|uniref:Dihydrolipoyllysine-residue succinyltransferase component of 2-oxoglutarate dehydrogenase complex n=1 Tax=Cohnella herbarum TaxID=2728023 RepID=A0A7Z2ZM10_9BACL|nr:2-oxoglutarate dehydrogenase complex dihydrolipoyllysine-residue succinyltransferase [Cohnella herbarum]QJD84484.1 2-oxoglutarate dehydrogenase complex dihydrolipoyllysine-residue succinyltransferase [Cohnella herbarum]
MHDIIVPAMGESITEGTISKWIVKVGDSVKQGDLLLELETDKVNLEISAEQDGVISEILAGEGDTVKIGESVGKIGAAGQATAPAAAPAPVQASAPAAAPAPAAPVAAPAQPAVASGGNDSSSTLATPAARKLAREKGIDLNTLPARDPIGRIHANDVASAGTASAGAPAPAPQAAAAKAPAVDKPTSNSNKPEERKRMSRRRLTIAKRLVEAQQTAAMLTTFNEVDMSAILEIRKRRKDSFKEKHEVGLGFMSFFTKAVVGALKAFPHLNAEINGEDIIVKKYYDIGIAVSAKEGLVVPVLREADRLGFAEIERTIVQLAGKARNNTLELSELQGGTFTITNGGVFGSLLSTPILNAPQVGILGMHKIQLRPVAIDAERMENRPMMYIALSYDHRIVDGAEAVQFLVKIKEMLEDPETLLLEG